MYHKPIYKSFKINPLEGLSGGLSQALKPSDYDSQLDRLLDHIYAALDRYSFALVRNQSFSLVNICSVKQNASVGYSQIDHPKLNSEIVLTLTFSLTARPPKRIKQINNQIPLMELDYLWTTRDRGSDYLTLTLNFAQMRQMNLEYNNIKHLLYLYNCIGMCTKSFVIHPRGWYESHVYSTGNLLALKRMYLLKNTSSLFKDTPFGYWIYNKEFWQNYSHLIVSRLIDEKFYKYFTVNILGFIPVPQNEYGRNWIYSSKPDSYLKFVESGVKKLVQCLFGSVTPQWKQDDLYCAMYLLYRVVEPASFETTEAYEQMHEFYLALRKSLEDRTKFMFLQKSFVGINDVSLDLIRGDSQLRVILSETLGAHYE